MPFAEFEVDLSRMRTPRGDAYRQGQGQAQGPGLEAVRSRQAHLRKLHAAGERTIAELAEFRPTAYRVLKHDHLDPPLMAPPSGGWNGARSWSVRPNE